MVLRKHKGCIENPGVDIQGVGSENVAKLELQAYVESSQI
jgi:hypothetical protein